MRLRLLGTGASDGWPNPWCGCRSCTAAAAQGVLRGQTSVLVDDVLLLDLGPEAPRAALRQGVSLAGVRAVLVTHGHEDHHGTKAWMWRGWAAGRGPLTLVAPPAVLEDARPLLDDAVETVPVLAGDRVSIAGYEVVALPAEHGGPRLGPAVLYDVTGPDGARLLYATDTGVLPVAAVAAARDRAYDVVLLELSGSPIPSHLTLGTWPGQVARLREAGAVTDRTRLCAVHLGHGNPPPDELDALLAGWGATAPRDGQVLDTGGTGARVLVLGGARSGKSAHAERLLAGEPEVTYVATAPPRPGDEEWAERVRAHVARRPGAWRTVETGDVAAVLREAHGAVLVDDLGLWLTRVLDDADAWEHGGAEAFAAAYAELAAAWATTRAHVVLVAPQVGHGVVPLTAAGRLFRDLLGTATAGLAAGADEVVEVVAGLPRRLKGPGG